MNFKENTLTCEEYCNLRESVGWLNFSQAQTEKILKRSLYTVTVYDNSQAVGMGRVIGDGVYYTIVDVIIRPAYQQKGIGSKIFQMLVEYVDQETPVGGCASIQLIAEKGKEPFYEKSGFRVIPHECCGSGMRKMIRK